MSDPSAPTEPPGPTEPSAPTAPAAPQPPVAAEPPSRGFVEKNELIALFMVAGVSLLLLGAFFYVVVYDTTLLRFPLHGRAVEPGTYFTDALEYRERRTALALMLRSFVTGFGFVVGLALATMGGIFILRQVKALTTLNLSPGTAAADDTTPEGLRSWLKSTQFSFQSYSPGVVFMLGGLGVIGITQVTALPVMTPEVSANGPFLCWDDKAAAYRECRELALERLNNGARAETPAPVAAGTPGPTPAPAPETAAAPATLDARCRADAADRPKFCETVNAEGAVK